MKKISVLLLMTVLVSGTLAGCSGTENSVSRNVDTSADAEADSGQGEEGGSETASFGENIEFEPVTAIENENCIVRITDLIVEKGRYKFIVELENTSTDQTYTLSPGTISVEGLIYDPDFEELRIPAMGASLSLISDAAPGTVESGKIWIDTDVFQEIGITDFTDIGITLQVKNYDNLDLVNGLAAEGTVHIYPHGQENAAVYTREPQDTDIVLADTAEITLTAVGSETDEENGDFTEMLYLQNKLDQPLTFRMDENSLNGYMMDSFPYGYGTYVQIPAGASSYLPMEFDGEDLQTNGITDVEEIGFKFSLNTLDDMGYPAELLLEETYTVTPAAE